MHRQHDDAGAGRELADAAAHLQAGQPGHHEIGDEQIGPQALDQRHRCLAVAGLADDGAVQLALQQDA